MIQPGILPGPPSAAFHLLARRAEGVRPAALLGALGALRCDASLVVGVGAPLAAALGADIPGLRSFPALSHAGVSAPSTQTDLWLWCRGRAPDEAFDAAFNARLALGDLVEIVEDTAGFSYRGGRDLSGYEDGTENPTGDEAVAAAVVSGAGDGLDGGSFAALQRWRHDLRRMAATPAAQMNAIIGRDRDSNEELEDAPVSAHVRRSAQEDFDPAAFMLRRSMPWGGPEEAGLVFLAFGADLDRFERVLRRMMGLDDGVVDGLFGVSTPVTGGYYWCPPLRDGRLDLRTLGA